jgi:hypothetical protein
MVSLVLAVPAVRSGGQEQVGTDGAHSAPGDSGSKRSETVETARVIVAEELGRHGLTDAQIEERLGQLSDEDLLYLADHASQVQEGGTNPPEYIWVLLGVFLVVAIVAALL